MQEPPIAAGGGRMNEAAQRSTFQADSTAVPANDGATGRASAARANEFPLSPAHRLPEVRADRDELAPFSVAKVTATKPFFESHRASTVERRVYLLHHVRFLPEGVEDVKVIGIYSSLSSVLGALECARRESAFCDCPALLSDKEHCCNGFFIHELAR